MKTFHLTSLFVTALALTFSACEKNVENLKTVSEVKAATTSAAVVYPLVGTDTSNSILPRRKLPNSLLRYGNSGDVYPNLKVQVIDTVCPDYLNGTVKFDLSNLAEAAVTNLIRVKGNAIDTDPDFKEAAFRKLSHGSSGWWTHWNYSPYTESENPIVLLAVNRRSPDLYQENSMSISLRHPVRTFGFEIAPNTIGKDMKVVVIYKMFGADYRAPTLFEVEQTVSSPSGARLIAVKSNAAFGYISINLSGDIPFRDKGFAIGNIRIAD